MTLRLRRSSKQIASSVVINRARRTLELEGPEFWVCALLPVLPLFCLGCGPCAKGNAKEIRLKLLDGADDDIYIIGFSPSHPKKVAFVTLNRGKIKYWHFGEEFTIYPSEILFVQSAGPGLRAQPVLLVQRQYYDNYPTRHELYLFSHAFTSQRYCQPWFVEGKLFDKIIETAVGLRIKPNVLRTNPTVNTKNTVPIDRQRDNSTVTTNGELRVVDGEKDRKPKEKITPPSQTFTSSQSPTSAIPQTQVPSAVPRMEPQKFNGSQLPSSTDPCKTTPMAITSCDINLHPF